MLLLLAACGNSTLGPANSEDWFPLTIGNWWLYDIDGSSIYGADTLIYAGSIERRITDLIDHQDGFLVYELRSIANITITEPDTSTTSADTSFVYLSHTSDELKLYSSTYSSQYEILMKYPVTLNETWMQPDSSSDLYEVTDISAFTCVPAGHFSNCAVITESCWQASTVEHIYHRGTGKLKTVFSTDYFDAEESLRSYNIQ